MTAEEFATQAHAGQFRKASNVPYVEHCRRVADMAHLAGLPADAVDAAWLHDVVEDTAATYTDLHVAGFSDRTVTLVRLLTKWWPEQVDQAVKDAEKPKYYAAIAEDADAVVLKLLDRSDNLRDMEALVLSHRKWARNYLRKTVMEFEALAAGCHNAYALVVFEMRLKQLKFAMSTTENV